MNFSKLNMLIKLGREFGHEQIRDAGFSDTGHAICTFLCFHDHVSQDMIANAIMLDKTTVAKALRNLEETGFVAREQDERNRRKNIIRITEAGKASVSGSMHIYDNWFSGVTSCLSAQEQAQFEEMVDRMIRCALQQREQTPENHKA